ncbi:MAG: thioredoxin domain-containing protein [Proteobacteria bacterium]|nr:thioredoxin domain-containing protein [Pseudomonadota bacterium]MBU1689013.1 thioredoxin domain-containing protein [Pseudomonadota bacterium]
MKITEVNTDELPEDGGERFNRLIFEKSPYLRQHAENPIAWYPWGEAAFTRARAEHKPLFLSIGYATCHWCHVMAEESFTAPEVAALLNRDFIAIKVDREERPDIDGFYMQVCQTLTGGGGWPLTIIMTPDRAPFFAGTYFPKTSQGGHPGLMELLKAIADLWALDPMRLKESASEIIASVSARAARAPEASSAMPDQTIFVAAHDLLARQFDQVNGGFGEAPKFPIPHQLLFLLCSWRITRQESTLAMVTKTLSALRRGGIYDQIGFGLHRYSTDRNYLVPHFEKMLYDQALFSLACLEGFQVTGDQEFSSTAREIFSYVERELTDPAGGFYSAEDADSEGVEGKFYLWSTAEVIALLGPKEGTRACSHYNLLDQGNFHDERSGLLTGLNIPHILTSTQDDDIESWRQRLFSARDQRIHPFKDDKILTDWNGLMIGALARGARILDDERYSVAATRSVDFIRQNLLDPQSHLLHRFRDNDAALPGYLDDYAFLVFGLLELYQATFRIEDLEWALELSRAMLTQFRAPNEHALSTSGPDHEELPIRIKEFYDGALPSGNSIALWNLVRLERLLGTGEFTQSAQALAKAIGNEALLYPSGYTMYLCGLQELLRPTGEVVIVGEPGNPDTTAMLAVINQTYNPGLVVLLRPSGAVGKTVDTIAPRVRDLPQLGGRTTCYPCLGQSCRPPVTTPEELAQILLDQ